VLAVGAMAARVAAMFFEATCLGAGAAAADASEGATFVVVGFT